MECKDCKWWDKFQEDGTNGFCHRYPPIVNITGVFKNVDIWDRPEVFSDDWCGEFEQKQ